MQAYLVDLGILLDKTDKEFEYYSCVYDHQYGYYDLNQYYVPTLEEATRDVETFVKKTNDSYGIISVAELNDDFNFDCELNSVSENYLVEDIEWSLSNQKGIITENFIKEKNK
jgi:hypothetical protein